MTSRIDRGKTIPADPSRMFAEWPEQTGREFQSYPHCVLGTLFLIPAEVNEPPHVSPGLVKE